MLSGDADACWRAGVDAGAAELGGDLGGSGQPAGCRCPAALQEPRAEHQGSYHGALHDHTSTYPALHNLTGTYPVNSKRTDLFDLRWTYPCSQEDLPIESHEDFRISFPSGDLQDEVP